MNYKRLIEAAELRTFSPAQQAMPALPADGTRLLRDLAQRFPTGLAAFIPLQRFGDTVELSAYPQASGPWYADRRIQALVWMGDLVIEGDLVDDAFDTLPVLIVTGSLRVRHWLRGGMPGFVGGDVHASGFVVGHYNDAPLFVGGNLLAAGYVPRAKPYRDLPTMRPHQIAGRIEARHFDAAEASDEALRAAFVDEVLDQDDDGCWLDEQQVFERANAGQPVWRADATGT